MTMMTGCRVDQVEPMQMNLQDARLHLDLLERRNETIYLGVPFAEKDEAKASGARWDPSLKSWYAPPRAPIERFQRWLTGVDKAAFEIVEYDREKKKQAQAEWRALPPRSTDPAEIVALAGP